MARELHVGRVGKDVGYVVAAATCSRKVEVAYFFPRPGLGLITVYVFLRGSLDFCK